MNLQTSVYTHVAIYNDGAKDFLTKENYQILYNESESDGVWMNGKYIRFSNIARIITVAEYQEKYKKEQPGRFPVSPIQDPRPSPEQSKKGLDSLRNILIKKGILN